jgi:mannose-6-phosphate isomerase-like protein (cupin superfamily)
VNIVKRFKERKKKESGDLTFSIYFESDLITSGIAFIPAGGKGKLDKGHPEAEEVFTVSSGSIEVSFPDTGDKFNLGYGDALLIPVGVPHKVENHSKEDAVFMFSLAPKL